MSVPPSSPVVLVTGSSHGGIGSALCEAFAAKGCTVYASARRLESVSSFTQPSIRPLHMDVTSTESVNKAVEHVIEEAGRVDIVVANAGIACHGPVLDISIEYAQQAIDTNVLGTLRLAHAVFPHMAERKRGTFITIGSVVGYTPTPWAGIYAATKAAQHTITETLQMEAKALSPNIHVMLVVPGGVKSNFANNSTFRLPETSLYKSYLPSIIARLQLSQTGNSMPAAKFAAGVAAAALRKGGPPRMFTYGDHSRLFAIMRWLPKGLVLWFFWRRMSKLRA